VIRRARDRAEAPPPPQPPPLADLASLRAPAGRATLEQLIRKHGAQRSRILAELVSGWRRSDGAAPDDADLTALLDHHGLAHAFERRERDELLRALRLAGGVRPRAAERVGAGAEAFAGALERLGITRDAERIRDERRADLRARATLSERVRLLLEDPERLADLGLLQQFEDDLRVRLPEHVRALRSGAEPLGPALMRSLSISPAATDALAARFGLDLGPAEARGRAAQRQRPAARPDRRARGGAEVERTWRGGEGRRPPTEARVGPTKGRHESPRKGQSGKGAGGPPRSAPRGGSSRGQRRGR
jgi:hypothetical protein